MKLVNKKTGEVATLTLSSNGEDLLLMKNDEMVTRGVKLSDLEEWEDYEEAKEYYYYIDDLGNVSIDRVQSSTIVMHKNFGNYFETREEAEKAVEKLKAWKRLKDARLKFTDFGYNLDELSSSIIGADGKICFEMLCYEDFSDDLELLFGGEE